MYITVKAKVEEVEDSSYTNTRTGEVIEKTQLSLVVPSMRERLTVELPAEVAPKASTLEQWEMEETWVVVTCKSMRAFGFTRENARAGEKGTGAMVVFQAAEIHEASPEERKQLQEARKIEKTQAKQRRAERRAEKEAAKAAEQQADEAGAAKQSA